MKMQMAFVFNVGLILALITAANASTTPIQANLPLETARFGMNPGLGALDWDPTEMFADAMKTFREVTRPDGLTPVPLDARGWPLDDCRFLVWHGLGRESGTYRLKFTGQANTITAAGATVQNKQYNAATNTTTADVIINGADYLYLTFTGTNGGVKNVKLMLPGHNFSETWNRDFLAALEPIPVIRLMDFTATNWNHVVTWSDRTLPNAATQQSHPAGYGWQGKGIAWEYAIDLLNVTDKDGWINIPAEANDAYVQSLINLIKNGGNGFAPLEADRKLYIEYSNEVWNGMFDQTQFNYEQAVAEVNAGNSPLNFDGEANNWYWAWRRVGKRIVEISLQFRAAFGDSQMMTRFRPVLAWQYDNGQATAENQLDFIQKYYGTSQWGYADPHPVDYYLWCGGGALYSDDITLAQDGGWKSAVQTDSKYAHAYGIHFCNYEGGMSFDGADDPARYAAWVTQDMIDRQKYYEEHGGNLLMYFNLVSRNEEGLGFLDTIRDLNMPKYDALLQLSGQAKGWENTYGASLPMRKDGADFSLARWNWMPPGSGPTSISPLEWRAYHFDVNQAGPYAVWVKYSSTANVNMKIYAGSRLVGTITRNTNGNTVVSPKYVFQSARGLQAIRIENHGNSDFTINEVRVEAGQAASSSFRSTAAYDGWLLESGEFTDEGGSLNAGATVFYLGDNAQDKQYRSILSFNTAGLPDNAVITKVTLKIRKQGLVGTNPFTTHNGLKVDIRKGRFGSSVNLQALDFQALASKNAVGTFNKTPTNNWYSANLGSAAFPFVNLTGVTQFRLRFARDDNDDNGADYLKFFSGNATATYRPQLIIKYYVPSSGDGHNNPTPIIEYYVP